MTQIEDNTVLEEQSKQMLRMIGEDMRPKNNNQPEEGLLGEIDNMNLFN